MIKIQELPYIDDAYGLDNQAFKSKYGVCDLCLNYFPSSALRKLDYSSDEIVLCGNCYDNYTTKCKNCGRTIIDIKKKFGIDDLKDQYCIYCQDELGISDDNDW